MDRARANRISDLIINAAAEKFIKRLDTDAIATRIVDRLEPSVIGHRHTDVFALLGSRCPWPPPAKKRRHGCHDALMWTWLFTKAQGGIPDECWL